MEARSRSARTKRPGLVRARIFLRTLAEREPILGVHALREWRRVKARWRRRSLRRHGRVLLWGQMPDLEDVMYVAPTSIVHSALSEFRLCDFRGAIVTGGWDKSEKTFTELDIYQAMKSVLKDRSCTWSATEWYARALRRLEDGEMPKGCRSKAELDEHLANLERLYATIAEAGYRSQGHLIELHPDDARGDEVAVAIGRSGELLFCDGAHRLTTALLIGVEAIPVQVAVRHPIWAQLRCELFDYARSEGGRLYQAALHPDLAAVPSAHGCEDRWALISSRLDGSGGRVLDIGANLGFFDNKLEDLGYSCTAVENDPILTRFMKVIRDANGHRFEVETDSILVGGSVRGRQYRVVLALNILHHFLKSKAESVLLERLLVDLEAEEMFFEPHRAQEPQMEGAYSSLTPEEFTEFVAEKSGCTLVDALGHAGDGRMVYHLRRAQ